MIYTNKKQKKRIGFSMIFSGAVALGTIATTELVFLFMWYFSKDHSIRLQHMSMLMIFVLTLVLGTFVSFALHKVFIRPLMKLTDAMNRVAKGDFTIQLDCDSRQTDLVEIYDSFNTMVKELSQTDTLQTDFISSVSHEFKTPINAIEGYASLLQDGSLSNAEQKTYVEKIVFNTHRLSELVGNVLLLSKINNQSIQAKLSTYRLDEQIRQSILALENKWEKKNISLDVELDEINYTGTERLMGHVWTNLIDNAVKFSPCNETIKLKLHKNKDKIIFLIENHGPVIAEQNFEKVFIKFFQCDASRKSEGNGLGLALAKSIVDDSNGTIRVKYSCNNVTAFEVTLPLSEEHLH